MVFGREIAHFLGLKGLGWVFELLILVAFFAVLYWIIKSSQKNETALDILNRRYAKGEINKNQYQELKKDILEK